MRVDGWVGRRGREERERGEPTSGDTLDASTTGETTDGGLGDALDVVAEDLAVAFCAAFAEAFAAFSACDGVSWAGVYEDGEVKIGMRIEGCGRYVIGREKGKGLVEVGELDRGDDGGHKMMRCKGKGWRWGYKR